MGLVLVSLKTKLFLELILKLTLKVPDYRESTYPQENLALTICVYSVTQGYPRSTHRLEMLYIEGRIVSIVSRAPRNMTFPYLHKVQGVLILSIKRPLY